MMEPRISRSSAVPLCLSVSYMKLSLEVALDVAQGGCVPNGLNNRVVVWLSE